MGLPKVVVGSGWWCSDDGSKPWISDEIVASPRFFELWYHQVKRCLAPERIFVTDSHSPVQPDHRSKADVEWCSLDRNYGHSLDILRGISKTRLCGFTRSVILGCAYALCCDADYYVYVEQDCLLRGDDFLKVALGDTTEGVVIGDRNRGGRGIVPGAMAAASYQQSLMVVRASALERFLSALTAGEETDGQLSPELKMERYWKPFDVLAVGYGRSRPIDFSRSHYYAQSWTVDELAGFLVSEGLALGDWFPDHERLASSAAVARQVGVAEIGRVIPAADAAIRTPVELTLHPTAPPDASAPCRVVCAEDNSVRFDSAVESGSRVYWSREGTSLSVPPVASDIAVVPTASYELLLPTDYLGGECSLQGWLIQYSDTGRLLHNVAQLRQGDNRIVFRTEVSTRSVRIAFRCAGLGQAEVGPLRVNRLERPSLGTERAVSGRSAPTDAQPPPALSTPPFAFSGLSQPSWESFYSHAKLGSRYDLVSVLPEGFLAPLYLRRATSDIDNFVQIFGRDEYSFLPITPQTILDLGGYVGLASAFLAQRYPDAKILLVEPDADNFVIAQLNTRQFGNVRCVNAGVWSKPCELTVADRVSGDWGTMFREVDPGEAVGSRILAMAIPELLERGGFGELDFLKMDIEGAEKVVFSAPDAADWIERCKVISCELHDRMLPGCSDALRDAMAGRGFEQGQHGEFHYYWRAAAR